MKWDSLYKVNRKAPHYTNQQCQYYESNRHHYKAYDHYPNFASNASRKTPNSSFFYIKKKKYIFNINKCSIFSKLASNVTYVSCLCLIDKPLDRDWHHVKKIIKLYHFKQNWNHLKQKNNQETKLTFNNLYWDQK